MKPAKARQARCLPDKFVQCEMEEAAVARCLLIGDEVPDAKLWHAPNVPTVFNAIMHLAPKFGIVSVDEKVHELVSGTGQVYYAALVTAKCGDSTRVGAAVSNDPAIVTMLAFRNAVKFLVSGDD